ncbi:MAG: DUF222 domain-containing protein [Nocardioidaceae bacterium]
MFDTLASAPHREDAGLDGSAACDGYVDVMSAKAARIVGKALRAVAAEQSQSEAEAAAAAEALGLVEDLQRYGELDELDATTALDRAAALQRRINLAEAEQLALAAHWADLHAACRQNGTTPGGERLVQRGGDGTPEVAEFAAAELGSVIAVSKGSAGFLIADALDLRHRLPLLWRRTQAGDVKVWIARRIAQRTRRLSGAAAARVDAAVADLAVSLPAGRLEKVLDAAVLAADPPQAVSDTEAAANTRGVSVGRDVQLGHQTVFGRADAPDITALDVLARAMTVLGDTDSHDVRRAKALGVLADPAAALELTRLAKETLSSDEAGSGATPTSQVSDVGTSPRRSCDLGRAVLYVHLSQGSLDGDGSGIARVHGIGPTLLHQVRGWLGHRQVTVKPVLDIAGIPAVDSYEVPAWMAEAIRLRTPADCFPYSANLSLNGDNEHNLRYVAMSDGGPPGQTAIDNLSWMPRGTHRAKTHGGWTVAQPRSGLWIWRSPHGRYFLVDHMGTTPLGKL